MITRYYNVTLFLDGTHYIEHNSEDDSCTIVSYNGKRIPSVFTKTACDNHVKNGEWRAQIVEPEKPKLRGIAYYNARGYFNSDVIYLYWDAINKKSYVVRLNKKTDTKSSEQDDQGLGYDTYETYVKEGYWIKHEFYDDSREKEVLASLPKVELVNKDYNHNLPLNTALNVSQMKQLMEKAIEIYGPETKLDFWTEEDFTKHLVLSLDIFPTIGSFKVPGENCVRFKVS
jgi:hypothetical protein